MSSYIDSSTALGSVAIWSTDACSSDVSGSLRLNNRDSEGGDSDNISMRISISSSSTRGSDRVDIGPGDSSKRDGKQLVFAVEAMKGNMLIVMIMIIFLLS